MGSKSKQFIIADKILKCPICENDMFNTQTATLNSTIANFLGIGKGYNSFKGYVCDKCSYILPFVEE